MSRAFVKEQDDAPEHLPDRPASANPNFVTRHGLGLIDAEIAALRRALALAQQQADKALIARASRDLRYWLQRHASAQVVDPPEQRDKAGFGTRVTIERSDGRTQTFLLVGEDEADPSAGTIAYTSPLARNLAGKRVGEVVELSGGEAKIMAIS